jgi:hypothetical protein
MHGNKENLQNSPLIYLNSLLESAKKRAQEAQSQIYEESYKTLASLFYRSDVTATWNEIFESYKSEMSQLLTIYSLNDLDISSNELSIDLHKVLEMTNHTRKIESTASTRQVQLDFKDTELETIVSITNPHGSPNIHSYNLSSLITTQETNSLHYRVTSSNRSFPITIMKRIWSTVHPESINSLSNYIEVVHGSVQGLDDGFTDSEKSSLAGTRWLNRAISHFKSMHSSKARVPPYSDDENPEECQVVLADDEKGCKQLAVSAIMTQLLQTKRQKDHTFAWSRILQKQKDVGIYLQYAHVRLSG